MRETSSVVVKRHYSELSPEETDEVVGVVADMIVTYLKGGAIRTIGERPTEIGKRGRQDRRFKAKGWGMRARLKSFLLDRVAASWDGGPLPRMTW